MGGALKVFLVMLAVPLVYSGLLFVFDSPLALWGALFTSGLLGIWWFHRARRRPVFMPYIVVWIILGGMMWYASFRSDCSLKVAGRSIELPALFCPFPQQ
jgi:hypothetical protein